MAIPESAPAQPSSRDELLVAMQDYMLATVGNVTNLQSWEFFPGQVAHGIRTIEQEATDTVNACLQKLGGIVLVRIMTESSSFDAKFVRLNSLDSDDGSWGIDFETRGGARGEAGIGVDGIATMRLL